MDSNLLKVAYVHGRNGPHPLQGKLAKSIGGEYIVVDFRIRWHDKPSSKLRRYLSWVVCALTFPKKKQYDIFLAAGPHFMMVLMRIFKQLRKNQKIIIHLGDETLYFLHANKYSDSTRKILIRTIQKYDAIICEGKMGADIARKIIGESKPIHTVFAGIPANHYAKNKSVVPNLKSKNIIFMGNGPSDNRLWYKGLDIMLESFSIAFENDSELKFTIIGEWDKSALEPFLNKYNKQVNRAITFVDSTSHLNEYLKEGALYLHCARGEAFGITILIAMLAGLPCIVSEWTGAKEVIEQVSKDLIVELNSKLIAKNILWYFNLSENEKQFLSDKGREIAENYTEEKAIKHYQDVFTKVTTELGLTKLVNTSNYNI